MSGVYERVLDVTVSSTAPTLLTNSTAVSPIFVLLICFYFILNSTVRFYAVSMYLLLNFIIVVV